MCRHLWRTWKWNFLQILIATFRIATFKDVVPWWIWKFILRCDARSISVCWWACRLKEGICMSCSPLLGVAQPIESWSFDFCNDKSMITFFSVIYLLFSSLLIIAFSFSQLLSSLLVVLVSLGEERMSDDFKVWVLSTRDSSISFYISSRPPSLTVFLMNSSPFAEIFFLSLVFHGNKQQSLTFIWPETTERKEKQKRKKCRKYFTLR